MNTLVFRNLILYNSKITYIKIKMNHIVNALPEIVDDSTDIAMLEYKINKILGEFNIIDVDNQPHIDNLYNKLNTIHEHVKSLKSKYNMLCQNLANVQKENLRQKIEIEELEDIISEIENANDADGFEPINIDKCDFVTPVPDPESEPMTERKSSYIKLKKYQ
jgi:hypothetical protein